MIYNMWQVLATHIHKSAHVKWVVHIYPQTEGKIEYRALTCLLMDDRKPAAVITVWQLL